MLQPIVRLEVYNKIVTGSVISYSSTPDYIIDNFSNLRIKYGIKKTKDTIDFSLQNHKELKDGEYKYSYDNDYNIKIKDLIKLYVYNEPMTGTLEDHLVLAAYVKSFDYSSTENIGNVTFKAFNRTEVLLNSFMFAPYNQGEQVPNMLVDSIFKMRSNNDTIKAYKDYTGTTSPGTKSAYDNNGIEVSGYTGYIRAYKNAAYKNDGSGEIKDAYATTMPSEYLFPNVVFVETYKPFIEHLEDLSSPKFTEDVSAGVYVSWVDNDDNLHWRGKQLTLKSDTSLQILREEDHIDFSPSKDVDEVVNAIIINAGTDPNENGILGMSLNLQSMGENGQRWKYVVLSDVAEEVRKKEIESGDRDVDGSTITGTDNAGATIAEDNYPDTFPWTIQTTGSDSVGGEWSYIGGTDTVANKNEYKNYFRRVCKLIAENRGQKIVDYGADAIYKCKVELSTGTLDYSGNEMVNVVIPSINFSKPLRIETVEHTIENEWITTLSLKEDIDYNLINNLVTG